MKPRVLLRGDTFRIIETNYTCGRVEKADGCDVMKVARWRDVTTEEKARWFDLLALDIGKALSRRRKRAMRRKVKK